MWGVQFSSALASMVVYHLRQKRMCVRSSVCAWDLRFTCTGRTLAFYLCSPHWPRIRGTIIQLCRNEPALGQIPHHHHHHHHHCLLWLLLLGGRRRSPL